MEITDEHMIGFATLECFNGVLPVFVWSFLSACVYVCGCVCVSMCAFYECLSECV